MLILDKCLGHQTTEVRDAVSECSAFLEFIPGGYTWRLQPMDVGVNCLFKDGIRSSNNDFPIEIDFNTKQKREDASRRIKVAFDGVKTSTVTKTFKKIV